MLHMPMVHLGLLKLINGLLDMAGSVWCPYTKGLNCRQGSQLQYKKEIKITVTRVILTIILIVTLI